MVYGWSNFADTLCEVKRKQGIDGWLCHIICGLANRLKQFIARYKKYPYF